MKRLADGCVPATAAPAAGAAIKRTVRGLGTFPIGIYGPAGPWNARIDEEIAAQRQLRRELAAQEDDSYAALTRAEAAAGRIDEICRRHRPGQPPLPQH